MSELTITEALAEIKTIGKRIIKKREFITNFIYRQEKLKDPLQSDGGSVEVIRRERQAIHDLEERQIALRRAIAEVNAQNIIKVGDQERSIADWLVWRRGVAPGMQQFLFQISSQLARVRQDAMRKGVLVTSGEAKSPQDIVVNVNEQELAQEIEGLEEILGLLDGQLSLKNATITF